MLPGAAMSEACPMVRTMNKQIHSLLKPFCHDHLLTLHFFRTELGQTYYGKNKHDLQGPALLVDPLFIDCTDLDDAQKLSDWVRVV